MDRGGRFQTLEPDGTLQTHSFEKGVRDSHRLSSSPNLLAHARALLLLYYCVRQSETLSRPSLMRVRT